MFEKKNKNDGWIIRKIVWLRGRWVANQKDGWLREEAKRETGYYQEDR
jgi:hypothetical protein